MMVYIVFILVYVIFSIHAHLRIRKSLALNDNRKRIHIILSWMIPFLWYLFIKDFIDYKSFTMTKKLEISDTEKNTLVIMRVEKDFII